MPAPEGGAAVEQGKGPVGIVRHIVHGKVADDQGIHEYAGGCQKAEGTCGLRHFQPAQFGGFALPELRRADGASGQGEKQGGEQTDIGGKVHGGS